MSAILLLGLVLGLDNLQVGAALGLLQVSRRRRWAIALSFGVCETVMPLLGLLLGRWLGGFLGHLTEVFGAAVLALSGLLIIFMSWRERDASEVAGGGLALLGLPVSRFGRGEILDLLASQPPKSQEELAQVPYFGEKRLQLYGPALLELLAQFPVLNA